MRELSIYIHIPFCVRKCLYCDFLSFSASEEKIENYVNCLLQEMKQSAAHYRTHQVVSVFLGGGTPSILTGAQIQAILECVKRHFLMLPDAEITMEMNPGTVTPEKLTAYLAAGGNRISIGLQSTQEEELRRIGRIHTYEQFLQTYELARNSGCHNINIDLMAALPGQSMASYRKSVERIAALEPEHISAYSLILEEGTPLYEHQDAYHFPTEDEDREMYLFTGQYLKEHGYHRYEISNYAREGCECRHNKVYWQRGDYVGFGLGASSMVENVRWRNVTGLDAYCAGVRNGMAEAKDAQTIQRLSVPEQMEEFMFLGLRMMEGVDATAFRQQFKTPIEAVYGSVLTRFEKEGLLQRCGSRLFLTERGIDVSNYVMAEFLLS